MEMEFLQNFEEQTTKSNDIPIILGWRPSSAPPDHSALHFIAVWAWKLLNEDLLQKYIP